MNWSAWVSIGSVLAALGVGTGAFGAHALKNRFPAEDLAIFEIGVRYQMYHAIALIVLGIVASKIDSNLLKISGWLLLLGTLIFSGSLYALVLTGTRMLGAVTPVGGVFLILGWILFSVAVLKNQLGS